MPLFLKSGDAKMKEFTVRKNDAGQRLDRFVGKTVPLLPSSLLQKYIRLKRIKVNGKGFPRDGKLRENDLVQMYINDEFFEKPNENNAFLKISSPRLDVLYEDENILLLNKEAGVLCHPDGGWSYDSLIARVQAYLYLKREWNPREENSFTPSLCNRIDRNTQGIVIAAKNAEALRIINEKIRDREIDKEYLTVVHGRPNPPAGRIESQLFKDAERNLVLIKKNREPGTRTAVTEYETLTSRGDLSLVRCRLLTGRTHQIRVQMASIHTPLLGDGKYGRDTLNRKFGESGQLLCSYRLTMDFRTDAGPLNYLKGRTFTLDKIDFVEKYFPDFRI